MTPTVACYERRADREASPGWAGHQADRALLGLPVGCHLHLRRGLRRHRGERGPHRGDHRPRAGARGHRGGRDDPRQDGRRPRGAQGQPALDDGQGGRLRDRPQAAAAAGTGARPASRPTSSTPSWSSSSVTRSGPSSRADAGSEAPAAGGAAGGQARRRHLPRRGRSAFAASTAQRAGHAGTLDPFATGLLLVLLGRATRLQRYLLPLPKTYRATARLGWRSTTGDPDGELSRHGRGARSGWSCPRGEVRQRVPMTSAVKVEGERLYRRAHRGESVETPEREIDGLPRRAPATRRTTAPSSRSSAQPAPTCAP